MTLPLWIVVLVVLIVSAIVGVVSFNMGVSHRRKEAEAKIGSEIHPC